MLRRRRIQPFRALLCSRYCAYRNSELNENMEFAHLLSSLQSGAQRTSLVDCRLAHDLQISDRPSSGEPRSATPTRRAPPLGEATETHISRSTAMRRKGLRLFWTWQVRWGQTGCPPVSKEVRQLIRRMSRENPLWGG